MVRCALWLGVVVALLSTADAAPTVHQGRALDVAGSPLQGEHTVEVSLYEQVSGGVALWDEAHSTAVDNGYYAVSLGSVAPIPRHLLDGRALWLEVSIDGVAMGRQAFSSVPHATVASGLAVRVNEPHACDQDTLGATYVDANTRALTVCVDGQWTAVSGGQPGDAGAVSFNSVTGAAPSSVQQSNDVLLDTLSQAIAVVGTAGSGLARTTLVRNGQDLGVAEGVYQPGDTLALSMVAPDQGSTSSTVIVYVGGVSTSWTVSTAVNQAPSQPGVTVTPDLPNTTSTLTCAVTTPSIDPEGQSISYSYRWMRNGVFSGVTGTTVSPSSVSEADLWECQATASDGQDDSVAGVDTARIAQIQVFGYSGGDQTVVVPAWATAVSINAWGAAGGGGSAENGSHRGGPGGYAAGRLAVSPGETLTVKVGQGGDVSDGFGYAAWPNGGLGSARPGYRTGGGGGRSAVQRGATELVVAGGGGGAGGTGWNCGSNNLTGGGGGGVAGGNGGVCPGANRSTNCQGNGGTQDAGGAAGPGCPYNYTRSPGAKNQGGHGGQFGAATSATYGNENAGGGGGDGYYGGGAGMIHAGGGGGSSYVIASAETSLIPSNSGTADPPQNTHWQYANSAGVARTNDTGLPGRVVLIFH